MKMSAGQAGRELRLSCGTLEGRLTVAPFRAWRGSASRVAQDRDPRAAGPTNLAYSKDEAAGREVIPDIDGRIPGV